MLVLSTGAQALSISSLKISEDPVEYLGTFDTTAKISGGQSGMMRAKFYVDNFLFATKIVGEDKDEIKATFDISSDVWSIQNIDCGPHKLTVAMFSSEDVALNVNESIDFNIGTMPTIKFSPSQPQPSRDVRVLVTDPDSGNPIGNVNLMIKDVYGGGAITGKTNSQDGGFTFNPQVAGEYKLRVDMKKLCGMMTVLIKRPLLIDGPRPDNPVVNEMVLVAVPSGASVGVKIYDSSGKVVLTPPVSYNGGSNFSITQAGTYIVAVGDDSTKYWSLNKTITVYDRDTPAINVAPDQPVVGKAATITVTSRGTPLSDATITVKRPDGVERDFTTNQYGSLNYDSLTSTGTYTVRATKQRYATSTESFDVKHAFDVKFDPLLPTVKDTITMTVNDENAKPVADVLVEIPSASFKRVTDMGGKISFNLQEPKEYSIKVSKDLYWDRNMTLVPYGTLTIGDCVTDLELGGSVPISAFDGFKIPISVDMNFKDPKGIIKFVPATQTSTYTPAIPGDYVVTISKTNYVNTNLTFTVRPHPLNATLRMQSGQLIVNVTSHGVPVPALWVSVLRPGESLNGTTDDSGVAVYNVNTEGNATVEINPGYGDVRYDTLSLRQVVVRSYSLLLLTTPLIIIFIITLMTIIITQIGRKYLGGGEWKMPSFGGGKPKMKTKHDSVLLGGDKGKRNSRLSKL